MKEQLVQLALINKALYLHENTHISSTLTHIKQLIQYRQNHQHCSDIIQTLQHQLAITKVYVQQQVNLFLKKKVKIAEVQSQKLLQMRKYQEMKFNKVIKKYPIYNSIDQFMQNQFEIKSSLNQQKADSLYFNKEVSPCRNPNSVIQSQTCNNEKNKNCEEETKKGNKKNGDRLIKE